ncbi:MAG: response regulator [Actinomycetaceae bacterium]|nr:response regulator [Actinomycetaceae bacterium]
MKLAILIVEDEPEVRDALERDLEEFHEVCRIEVADSVDDAWAAVDEVDEDGDMLALVLADHRLPGKTGVDFLVEMMEDARTVDTRKVLVTGQADQDDTIRALNDASLDHYFSKPWNVEKLLDEVRELLTDFVLSLGVDPLPHMRALNAVRVMDALR